jgi:type I restriction enzyme R subunit
MSTLTESTVEEAALAWLASSGYSVACGPDIAVSQTGAERSDPTYRDVVLEWRLREALVRLNPDLPQEALDDAFRKIVRADGPSLIERNRAVHKMLVNGVTVEYHRPGEPIRGAQVRVIDFDDPDNNDWLAVNQFTVVGPQGHNRRADIVVFVNGLPLGVIELENRPTRRPRSGRRSTSSGHTWRKSACRTSRRQIAFESIRMRTMHFSSRVMWFYRNLC